jgi:ATP-binding cassette subfamily B protein
MSNRSNIKELLKHLVQYKWQLAVVLISLLCVSFALLGIGLVFRHLVDYGISDSSNHIINQAILYICCLVTIFAIGSFYRSYSINMVALKVVSQLKNDVYNHLLNIEIAKFENIKIGDVLTRLTADIELVNSMIINVLSFFIRNMIMFLGAIAMMFLQSPKFSLLVLGLIPILLLPIIKLSKKVRALARIVLEEQGDFASFVEENIMGIRTIYAYNQQERMQRTFLQKSQEYMTLALQRLKMRSLFFAVAISLVTLAITSVIWVGSFDIVAGKISSGKMISFIYYAIMAGMSAGGMAELVSEVQSPLAALERILDLRNISVGDISRDNKALQSNIRDITRGDIIFKNVSFSYPARPEIMVLDDVSFTIRHGHFTGIVGRSGSGKSSMLQLLVKFYQQQKGEILLADVSIKDLSSDFLRSKIAYIEQNPVIFSGTLRSNIIFARPDCSVAEFDRVIEICGIDKIISQLPQGFETTLGERGVRLSGGQKQRIAIARGLLIKPDILLLDEASSALDSESEEAILAAIGDYMHGKTMISISHRVSSLQATSQILVCDGGKIVATGTHDFLLKNCELYQHLSAEHS